MKRTTIIIFAVFVTTGLMATMACDTEEKKTHAVTVKWDIAGAPSCESEWDRKDEHIALLFDKVQITVFKEEGDLEPFHDTVTMNCDEHQYTIHQLKRGTYYVQIEAMADFEGQYLPYFKGGDKIVAPAKDDEDYPVSLRLNTGYVEVGWDFEKGQCNSSWNGVESVIISLEGTDPSSSVESEYIPCEQAQHSFDDMEWDLYKLAIEGFNEAGELTHRGVYGEDLDTDSDLDAGTENLLDIRPGTHIIAEDAYISLKEL